VWRKGLGMTYSQNDYEVWRAYFGQTTGSGAVLPSAEPDPAPGETGFRVPAAVPEPSSLALFALGVPALVRRHRCRHRHRANHS